VTETDPDYAPAWAALAITADVLDDNEAATGYAQRALQLDPDNVDALTALGGVYRDTYLWAQAAATLERALAIDPDSAELLEDYGEFLGRTGRMDKLMEVTARGYAVDPYLSPLVEVYSYALMANGHTDQAIDILRQTIARGGADWLVDALATAYLAKGDGPGLREVIAAAPIPQAEKTPALDALDRPDDSARVEALRSLMVAQWANAGYAKIIFPELVLLYLGRPDLVIENYRELMKRGNRVLEDPLFTPAYAALRANPDFPELLELAGLPDYWDQSGWPEFCKRNEDRSMTCT
jgi:tetratricopeptide (TPR) repeat protein